uniref:DNA excision repair protein ERCC-6-like n=1 Tax=Saccoglossus kowalevskii TaxID=10224 RepID=A0ABM0GT96_SACKO|nr:PREDICTED: DNA excision repair protein ERCC-6-like [Saccoglossus kowalevskii]
MNNPEEVSTSGYKNKSVLHIDTALIPQVPSSQQSEELRGLNVDVYSHAEFEQNVLQQVDDAIIEREREFEIQHAEKELESVLDDIRLTKQDLSHIKKVLSNIASHTVNKETQRRLISVKKQKDNKQRQLKKLRAKQKKFLAKINGTVVDLEESDSSDEGGDNEMSAYNSLLRGPGTSGNSQQETEQERLIRLGEMTPFGNQVKKKVKKTDDPSKIKNSNKLTVQSNEKKIKKKQKSSLDTPEEFKDEIDDRQVAFLENRRNRSPLNLDKLEKSEKRRKRKNKDFIPNWESGSDDDCYSDYHDDKDDDDEYIPDEKELKASWKSEDYRISKTLKNGNATKEPSPRKRRKKVDDEDEDWDEEEDDDDDDDSGSELIKQSKNQMMKKLIDDANEDMYHKRLKRQKKEKLMKKKARIDAGESESDEDVDDYRFEGGLKIPGQVWCKLYKYQKTGVKWLWELHCQQTGGIVGDEMGLGKTIQIISFLSGLKYSKLQIKGDKYIGLGPVLIVCPTTVMHQWVREFHTWYPDFRVAIFHDSGSYSGSKASLVYDIVKSRGVLVTSYAAVRIQQDMLLRYQWDYVILDEGHKIRNPDADVTQACKQFRTPHRIILSGSPMQNNLRELWSLFDFVFPGKLGTLPVFMQEFSVPITMGGYSNASDVQVQTAYKCACVLRDTINPYLLRRMKQDVKVNLNLPDKNEQVLFCRLTPEQVDVYKEYIDSGECHAILTGRYKVFAGLITLRKICNHPDISTGGPRVLKGDYEHDDDIPEEMRYGYWKKSGKLIVIESLLKLWKKQGHRVLLFTQSKQMLDILDSFVTSRGYNYMRMDGSTPISSRQPAVNRFNQDKSVFVFLLTTRVGGLGVNLIGADRVVIYDPDWNPSTDMQARERAWRIGQNKQVTIYRLLTSGTIEEKIYHRQIFKQFLTNRVLKDPKQRRFFKTNDLHELFTLTSQDTKQGTETHAIFAGTGSDITINLKKSKIRRSHSNQQLCEERNKQSSPILHRSLTAPGSLKKLDEIHTAELGDNDTLNSATQSTEEMHQEPKAEKDGIVLEGAVLSGDSKAANSVLPGDSECGKTVLPADSKHRLIKKVLSNDVTTAKHHRKDIERQHRHGHKPDRHFVSPKHGKKKRKRRNVFEGKKIAYLDHHDTYHHGNDDDKEERHDDYVLAKLFKKSGVHSALQHDNVIESANPDFLLVEGEANRVAKEATKALKLSRKRCRQLPVGVPTWTGQSGAAGAPKAIKPRFGQKSNFTLAGLGKGGSNSRGSSSITADKKSKQSSMFGKKKLFNGEVCGTVESTSQAAALPASTDLLTKMRERNNVVVNNANAGDNSSSDEDTSARPLPIRARTDRDELIEDIRNFIAFQGSIDGQATTKEILKEFEHQLPSNDSAIFKAMLQQICTFYRQNNGIGLWKLKPEFR